MEKDEITITVQAVERLLNFFLEFATFGCITMGKLLNLIPYIAKSPNKIPF